MGNDLKISIITPSYNQGQFLAATIESVLGQEGDFFLDYIVVDGGSTDDSVGIIKSYERALKEKTWPVKCRGLNYRWRSEQDEGQSDALMKGFRLAEGEILAWLNSDDLYLPGALQAASSFLRDNPGIALLYGDAYNCDTDGNIVGRYPVVESAMADLAYSNFICQPSTFFRKRAFEEVGGLDPSLHYGMDFDLFAKIGQKFSCGYLPRVLSAFRLHDSSKTMRDDVLHANLEETLLLAYKHFDWAPVNRIFASCYYYSLAHFPRPLVKLRFPVAAAVLWTFFRYLRLNRGLRRQDLQLLNMENFKKLFKERTEMLRGRS